MFLQRSLRKSGFGVILAILLLALMTALLAACDDDEVEEPAAAEPTAAPTAVAEAFEPRQVFQLDIDDQDTVGSVAFAPDGDMVAAGTYLEIHLLDPDDGSTIGVIDADHSVDDVEFSPDGSLIAAGQAVYGVKMSDIGDGDEHLILHGGYDNFIAFAPDGETIATANRDGVLWIWDTDTGEKLNEFAPPVDENATSVAFGAEGESVALGNLGGDVIVWNVESGELVAELENPGDYGAASRIDFAPVGEHIAVAGAQVDFDDVVRVWNVENGSDVGTILFDDQTRAVAYAQDGSQLAGAGGATILIVDPDGLDVIHEIELEVDPEVSSWITDLAYSPDGRMLFVSRWDGTVEMWQVQD